eukprot:g11858.t1
MNLSGWYRNSNRKYASFRAKDRVTRGSSCAVGTECPGGKGMSDSLWISLWSLSLQPGLANAEPFFPYWCEKLFHCSSSALAKPLGVTARLLGEIGRGGACRGVTTRRGVAGAAKCAGVRQRGVLAPPRTDSPRLVNSAEAASASISSSTRRLAAAAGVVCFRGVEF